ncbi:hypothetical protein CDAR_215881 [Caerostris darwini]|uniref:Uncharacterized protein n=1 Tax=Caerostris darwini TaxID=1538125 RepID=A0AAV4NJA1_9ARAC|nr:hypothetical protein CDAR_215881 [Caerostris darwini]
MAGVDSRDSSQLMIESGAEKMEFGGQRRRLLICSLFARAVRIERVRTKNPNLNHIRLCRINTINSVNSFNAGEQNTLMLEYRRPYLQPTDGLPERHCPHLIRLEDSATKNEFLL